MNKGDKGINEELLKNDVESKQNLETGEKNEDTTGAFRKIIDDIVADGNRGIIHQGAGKKLIEAFFHLPPNEKEAYFRSFPQDIRKKILSAGNISRFEEGEGSQEEKANALLNCICHTYLFKNYVIARRGFGKVDPEDESYKKMSKEDQERYEQKKYEKDEYDYWFSLSPEERMIIYPFLKNKPSRAKFFGRGVAWLIPGSILYIPEIIWRGVAKFYKPGGDYAFPLSELTGSVASRARETIEDYSDFKTWSRLGKISEIVNKETDGESKLTEGNKGHLKELLERDGKDELSRLVEPSGNLLENDEDAKERLEKLALHFRGLKKTPEEQIKEFGALQNYKVQFYLLGKGVIKNEAVSQCCELIEEHYKVTAESARNSFKKSNITSVNADKNAMYSGKKIFDLYQISKSGGKKPSAALEVVKGILKIVAMVAAIALSVSWLTTLGIAMTAGAAAFGLSALAANIIGVAVSGVCTALITKGLAKWKDIKACNPFDNFRKAKLIIKSNRAQEATQVKVDSKEIEEFKKSMNEKDGIEESIEQNQENKENNVQSQNVNEKNEHSSGAIKKDKLVSKPDLYGPALIPINRRKVK